MKFRTFVLLGLIGAVALAVANAKDIERYLRLRSM
jgi:hypothetical protein